MKRSLSLCILLFLTSCATSEKDIKALGAEESFIINKPFREVATCAEKQLDEKYDSALYFKKTNDGNTIMLYREEYNGGYWVQIDRQPNGGAKVSSYISNNMMFSEALSGRLLGIVKKGCL